MEKRDRIMELAYNELCKLKVAVFDGDLKVDDSVYKKTLYLKELLNFLKMGDIWFVMGKVYLNFDRLSEALLELPINNRDRLTIIRETIKRNIASEGFSKDVVSIFQPLALDEDVRSSFMKYLLGTDDRQGYYDRSMQEVPRETLVAKLEAMKRIYDNDIAKDIINDEQLEFLINDFKLIGVDERLINNCKKIWMGSIARAKAKEWKKKDKEGQKVVNVSPVKIETGPVINREYRMTRRIIERYYDLEQGVLKEDIDFENIIKIVGYMKKIKLPMEIIRDFVRKAELQNGRGNVNPISLYNEMYHKLLYYAKNDKELALCIDDINDCLREIFIASDEDYCFWKNTIKESLGYALKLIPYDGEYEINLI